MKKTITILVLSAFCIPAFALVPKPYLGVNLQANSPTGKFAKEDFQEEEGGAETGFGGEVDLGISSAMASAYIGYRFGKHDAAMKANVPGFGEVQAEGEWQINRWVLGARWHVFGGIPSPIVPTLGGGLTSGKTKASTKGGSGGSAFDEEADSKNSVGWFLEAGAIVRAIGNLSLIGDVQYHRFDAEYESDFYDGPVEISFFTIQVGARFALL